MASVSLNYIKQQIAGITTNCLLGFEILVSQHIDYLFTYTTTRYDIRVQQPILYLMFGYPGAGKTTIAQIISNVTGAVHLSSDAVRLELFPNPTFSQAEHDQLYQEIDTRAEALLKEGKSVIYDANLNRFVHRQQKYDICTRTGAKSVLLWVKTAKELAKERAVHDSRSHLWPKNETAAQLFDRVAGVLEPPQDHEPFITIRGEGVTEQTVRDTLNQLK